MAEVDIHQSAGRSRIDYITGPASGVSVVDNGNLVVRLDPATKQASICRAKAPADDVNLLLANYQAVPFKDDTVADGACYVVRLAPKYPGNPSKKLWIDKETFIPLRTERFDSDGKLASFSECIIVGFMQQNEKYFRTPRGWRNLRMTSTPISNAAAAARTAGFKPVNPSYIPGGYKLAGYSTSELCPSVQSVTLQYTNGLNVISVFERNGNCRKKNGSENGGASCFTGPCVVSRNQHARMVQARSGGLNIVIVSDLSRAELVKMASNFK
jgi:negative regulator of sigma E activity